MKKSYVFLANGFEEIEAMTTIDILRRAGMPVYTVSILDTKTVNGAHNIQVTADYTFNECDFSDALWLILPGGMPGATNLVEYAPLCKVLRTHNEQHGKIAAICASPAVVLAKLGILDGKEAICYPGFENLMQNVKVGFRPVVVSDNVITANGPATSSQFALAIVVNTLGEEKALDIAEGLLLYERRQEYYF